MVAVSFAECSGSRPERMGSMVKDDEDDAALRWEGDDELGRATSLDRPLRPSPARDAAPAPGATDTDPHVETAPRNPVTIVATALAALLFLAETVGWILVVQGVQAAGAFQSGSAVLDFLGGISRFLALLAAPLWFVCALRLTGRRVHRLGWFALGLGVLVPWPLLLGFVV